jgi:hypothetical protein
MHLFHDQYGVPLPCTVSISTLDTSFVPSSSLCHDNVDFNHDTHEGHRIEYLCHMKGIW